MLIKVSNFGPLSKFEFDIKKNLTVIVGANNIGKSYALTLTYLLLKRMLESVNTHPISFSIPSGLSFGISYGLNIRDLQFSGFAKIKDKIEESQIGEPEDITDIVISDLKSALSRSIAIALHEALQGTYGDLGNLANRFSGKHPEIVLEGNKFSIKMEIMADKIEITSIQLRKGRILLKETTQERQVRTLANGDFACYYSKLSSSVLEKNYLRLFFDLYSELPREVATHISDIHYLPASRSGLYQALSAFGLIIAELSKSRSFLSKKIELPGISEPLSDYFIRLSEARPLTGKRAQESLYLEYAAQIEDEIIKGKIEIDSKSKKLIYRPINTDLRLDLSSTSSMASEIGPIVTYLRHILPESESRRPRSRLKDQNDSKQIIFIEEPEAHLHPEIQVKLIEIIANLTRETKTRVIFTSHSNYIFNKISNMIISSDISLDSFKASLFKSTSSGTVATELDTDNLGIDDNNFADISENLYMERMSLIDKANEG